MNAKKPKAAKVMAKSVYKKAVAQKRRKRQVKRKNISILI